MINLGVKKKNENSRKTLKVLLIVRQGQWIGGRRSSRLSVGLSASVSVRMYDYLLLENPTLCYKSYSTINFHLSSSILKSGCTRGLRDDVRVDMKFSQTWSFEVLPIFPCFKERPW